jgi:O-antigen ligase
VVSLNRGLWLSLGIGVGYVAIRLGLLGSGGLLIRMLFAMGVLVLVLLITPLGDLMVTRIDTGHSNQGRSELVVTTLDRTAERPLLGWGAPRPNRDGLPPIGTHGQLWYLLFSHGILGALGYCGFFLSVGLRTWKQHTVAGLWAHSVLIIAAVQMFFYLAMPSQLFVMMAAAALVVRLPGEYGADR